MQIEKLSRADVLKISTEVFFDFNTPGKLSPVFNAVLEPVNLYAPLGSYALLYAALRRMAQAGFEDREGLNAGKDLYAELKDYFQTEECKQQYSSNPWARVIIILTMEAFAEFVSGGYPREIKQAYLSSPGAEHSEAVLAELQRLHVEAKQTPAGGAAFHFIANILLLLADLSAQLRGDHHYRELARYLDITEEFGRRIASRGNGVGYNDIQAELSAPRDACETYLKSRVLDRVTSRAATNNLIRPYGFEYPREPRGSWGWWPGRSKARAAAADSQEQSRGKTITAVMIGPPGSGKTTLIRQLIRANHRSVELGVGLQILFGPSGETVFKALGDARPPGTQETHLLQALLSPDGPRGRKDAAGSNGSGHAPGSILFNIFDSKGGTMFADPPALGDDADAMAPGADDEDGGLRDSDKLYHATTKANLLILAVPPESLSRFDHDEALGRDTLDKYFANFIAWVFNRNRNAMIAIAYTKCDEYGVRLGRARRIIEEEEARDSLNAYTAAADPLESDWQSFVSAASRRGGGGETPLLRELLTKTGALWKTTVRNSRHRFLNGYLVSAEPAADYLAAGLSDADRNWESLGLLQIFADFFAHLKATGSI